MIFPPALWFVCPGGRCARDRSWSNARLSTHTRESLQGESRVQSLLASTALCIRNIDEDEVNDCWFSSPHRHHDRRTHPERSAASLRCKSAGWRPNISTQPNIPALLTHRAHSRARCSTPAGSRVAVCWGGGEGGCEWAAGQ